MRRLLWRLVVIGAAFSVDVGCWSMLGADRAVGPHPLLPDLVTAVAAWVLQAALAWFTLLVVLVALEPVAGRELTGFVACPPGVRRLLLLLCGAVAVGAVTAPVHAAEPPAPAHRASTPQMRLDGLPLPDRTDDGSATAPAATAHLVRRGDSLWRIARAALVTSEPGRTPSNAEIDHAWRAWYAANAARVGADPDLIHPGTELRAPPGSSAADQS